MQAKQSRRGHCLENKNVFHKSFELTKIRRFCIKWASASEHCAKCHCHMWQSKIVMAAGCARAQCPLEQDVLRPGTAECPLSRWLRHCPAPAMAARGQEAFPSDVGAVLAPPWGTFTVWLAALPMPTQVAPRSRRLGGSGLCPPQKWALVIPALAGLCLRLFGLVPHLLQKLHSTCAARAKSVPSL